MIRRLLFVSILLVPGSGSATAETGYDLWLRYVLVEDERLRAEYLSRASGVVAYSDSPTAQRAASELRTGLRGLLGVEPPLWKAVEASGAIVVGTPAASPLVASLGLQPALTELGGDGFIIRSTRIEGREATVIASASDVGALYGVFHFLRLVQTREPVAALDIVQRPRLARRLLNHWDNLDGTIERGYAGRSLWNWRELPDRVDPRIEDYARANASLGINGTVLNNVNANPGALAPSHLAKVAALARVLRPYGIRVYLSANFAAPKVLGGLPTADPLDPAVGRWWQQKVADIYRLIPDFGGFLVKANSEGQPGPQDYTRSHAEGANVIADALAPHGGIVMWRAFVYDADVDPDRIKRAYLEFVPLDGRFRENVVLQVKNGPLDFQPREPFHPLFGAMTRTPVMAEVQITQEYLGQSTHLVYLAPMWKEFLSADTYADGPGSTVLRVLEHAPARAAETAIAGVANTGDNRNWSGHHFAQANWYAFGRLAWDGRLSAGGIAEEWIRMTWGHDPAVVATIRSMMLDSHDAYVDYTMPLGLHHLIGGDHYAPMPENDDPRRADWSAIYYHRADASGVGYDRTRLGSGAVDQYRPALSERWNDPATTPEKYLLWFHRLPWTHRLQSGRTLWAELVRRYARGAEEARRIEARWIALQGKVDDERHQAVSEKLRVQTAEAGAWRDKCLRYFQQFSRGWLPASFATQ